MSANLSSEKSETLHSATSRNALAIFCRAPQLGRVKTRLAATQGEEFALGLYRAMLLDSFALGRALAPDVETWAYFTPGDAFETTTDSLTPLWDGLRFPQCEGDLGAKMLHAFTTLRAQGYRNVVLMGSDSPDLPLMRLRAAFEFLQVNAEKHDLVVGPCFDGGFCFIGAIDELPPAIFEGIKWSTDSVYSELLANVGKVGNQARTRWVAHGIYGWHDVDDEADLAELRHRLFNIGTHAPHTRAFLSEHSSNTELKTGF